LLTFHAETKGLDADCAEKRLLYCERENVRIYGYSYIANGNAAPKIGLRACSITCVGQP
jgi:hypothetical protein